MTKIMKYCPECDRELAATFEECPFCKGEIETREIEEHVETEEERQQRHERARLARIKQKKQQRMLAIAFCVLVLFGVLSTARFADSEIPRTNEWFLTRSVKKTESPQLPELGIIKSQAELDAWCKTYRMEFPDTVDFTNTTLVYLVTRIENALVQGLFLEKVTANFMNTWAFYSQGKLFGDQEYFLGFNHMKGGVNWVSGVHVIAVSAKLTSVPKLERTGTDFSRRPPE